MFLVNTDLSCNTLSLVVNLASCCGAQSSHCIHRRRCMHVTNYSVNKHQPNFVANTDADCDGVGNKWPLRALSAYLESRCGVQWHQIWSQAS